MESREQGRGHHNDAFKKENGTRGCRRRRQWPQPRQVFTGAPTVQQGRHHPETAGKTRLQESVTSTNLPPRAPRYSSPVENPSNTHAGSETTRSDVKDHPGPARPRSRTCTRSVRSGRKPRPPENPRDAGHRSRRSKICPPRAGPTRQIHLGIWENPRTQAGRSPWEALHGHKLRRAWAEGGEVACTREAKMDHLCTGSGAQIRLGRAGEILHRRPPSFLVIRAHLSCAHLSRG